VATLPRKWRRSSWKRLENRRVNIGRGISVFGRRRGDGGARRWHAAGNTGVMQRRTRPQKSRATHPRAPYAHSYALPLPSLLFSLYRSPFSNNHRGGGGGVLTRRVSCVTGLSQTGYRTAAHNGSRESLHGQESDPASDVVLGEA